MVDMLTCHLHLTVKSKTKCVFFYVRIIREDKTFTTSFYRKSTFSGVYTHFDSAFYHLPISLFIHALI